MKPALFIMMTLSVLGMSTSVQASDKLSSEDIVNALQTNNAPLTRSLTGQKTAPKSIAKKDREFLNDVMTRGLRVEKIEDASDIIDESDLPTLDIEFVFELNSSKVSEGSLDELAALGTALQSEALIDVQILLNGHTDASGGREYNLGLSHRRALEVRSRLIAEYGIPADRIIAIGFGEERLKDTGNPNAGINRRVEVMNIGTVE